MVLYIYLLRRVHLSNPVTSVLSTFLLPIHCGHVKEVERVRLRGKGGRTVSVYGVPCAISSVVSLKGL